MFSPLLHVVISDFPWEALVVLNSPCTTDGTESRFHSIDFMQWLSIPYYDPLNQA